MLRVTVEIFPGGDHSRREKLGSIDIANVSEFADVSDYKIESIKSGRFVHAMVLGHRRSAGFWVLVGKAIEALGWNR